MLFLCEYRIAFTAMFKLCSIAITIPLSSSACERTFSCLKRIKSYLRNSLLDNNLSNLSVLSEEKSESKLLDIDEIIDTFSNSHNNRRIILKKLLNDDDVLSIKILILNCIIFKCLNVMCI